MARPKRASSLGIIGGALAVIVAAAACSSSGGSGSASTGSTGTTGSSANAAPLKIGLITVVGTALNFTDQVSAANAAIRQVNSQGGINGHKLQLVFCNEALDPNDGEACARDMVSDHVMAMVGTLAPTSEQTVNTILASAGIAQVGPETQGPGATDKNSFLLGAPPILNEVAYAKFAGLQGAKRVDTILLDSPITSADVPTLKQVLPTVGATLGTVVTSTQQGGDLSPQAAALMKDNPQVVIFNTSPASAIALMKAMDQLGYQGTFETVPNALTLTEIQGLGAEANQLRFVSTFPPITATNIPGIAQMVQALHAQAATGDQNVPSTTFTGDYQIDTYTAIMAIQKIADAAKATDAASFEKAINAATNVNLDGIIPAWTPDKPGPANLPRVSDTDYYFFQWDNGTVKLVGNDPIDVAPMLSGS
jgi:ABC-type branched-subunit amino acid transport system substrate-binding protein